MDSLKEQIKEEQIKVLRILAKIAFETNCEPIIVQIGRQDYGNNNAVFIKEAPPIVIETLVHNNILCFLEAEGMHVLLPAAKKEGAE